MQLPVSIFSGSYGFDEIGTAILGLLLLISIFRKLTGPKLPPGPLAWPLVGNLPLMGPRPHHSFLKLREKYGPLMFMQLGSVPTIVVQSPDMAKEVLKAQDHIFGTRPHTVTGEVFFNHAQDILFAPYGPAHKLFRHATINYVLTPKRIASFQNVRKEMLMKFLQDVLQESGGEKPVQVDRRISEMNFNNISKNLFGKSYYGLKTKKAEREFHLIADEWARVAGGVIVGDYLPYLRPLDIGGCEATLMSLREEFEDFLTVVIEEHKQSPPEPGQEAFVDILMSLPADEDGNSMTEAQIKSLLSDLTIAGIDTTAAGMQWALIELMRHPEVRKKAQAEVDAVVGKERMVEESDLARMPYIKAVVKETLRLHPAVPFTAPHESLEATKVAGYDIPKGTRLIVSLYGVHRDEHAWPEPEKFDPNRFLDPLQAPKPDDFRFIPFSAGRRMCPGNIYATLVVERNIATLVHSCDLALPRGVDPMDVDVGETFGVSLGTTSPLNIVFTPRLPLKVYEQAGIQL